MARVLILGAGVMGSALAVPAADNGHAVRLAATPLDADIPAALRADRAAHPRLGAPLPESIEPVDAAALGEADGAADLTVVAVSSPGIPWALDTLSRIRPQGIVALLTKGLVEANPPLTYAQAVPQHLGSLGLSSPTVFVGGPCIARELAERHPAAVVFASDDEAAAERCRAWLETPTYRVATSGDPVGVEACAALKNFFAIGVSAMLTRHQRDGSPVKNPVAAAFAQAIAEMERLTVWLGGGQNAVYGLAGVGDLHVTVGGGRNSRLGKHLGEGETLSATMEGPLAGETVEGVDVARVLAAPLAEATAQGTFAREDLPLARAIIDCIMSGGHLAYDVAVSQDTPTQAPARRTA